MSFTHWLISKLPPRWLASTAAVPAAAPAEAAPAAAAVPVRKLGRKVALMLMYSGAGFCGMQRQRHLPTIEGALLDCLLSLGYITQEQLAGPVGANLGFRCASRTDTGVSALAQLVTVVLDSPSPDYAQLTRDLNARLPDRLRVLDAVRVTNGFSANRRVANRTYAYLCPSFAFSPSPLPSPFAYRIEPARLDSVRACLARYIGTRNYRHFTSYRPVDDPSCLRFILDCRVHRIHLYGGLEFLELRFVGQSFMLHQIRKMVGLTVAIVNGHYPPWVMDAALEPLAGRVNVPRAPGLGLLLLDIDYGPYNRSHAARLGYPLLDWARFGQQREAFMAQQLMPSLFSGQAQGGSMLRWLQQLRLHQPLGTSDWRPRWPPPRSPGPS